MKAVTGINSRSQKVSLILDNSDISAWYITVHNKYHMVGYVSNLYGSAWTYAQTPTNLAPTGGEKTREITFQIFHEDITMLKMDEHRYMSLSLPC